jgi:hypothetical protein
MQYLTLIIDPLETNATTLREIISWCSRRRLCRLLFLRDIKLNFIGQASRRSSPRLARSLMSSNSRFVFGYGCRVVATLKKVRVWTLLIRLGFGDF